MPYNSPRRSVRSSITLKSDDEDRTADLPVSPPPSPMSDLAASTRSFGIKVFDKEYIFPVEKAHQLQQLLAAEETKAKLEKLMYPNRTPFSQFTSVKLTVSLEQQQVVHVKPAKDNYVLECNLGDEAAMRRAYQATFCLLGQERTKQYLKVCSICIGRPTAYTVSCGSTLYSQTNREHIHTTVV
jgi:hypothetical protein